MQIKEIVEREGYAYCHCIGNYDIEDFLEICDEGIRFSILKNKKSLLVNALEVTGGPLSALQRFELGEKAAIAQRNHPMMVKVAIVGTEPLIDPKRFGETVARNRGAVGRAFTDISEAIGWLEPQHVEKSIPLKQE